MINTTANFCLKGFIQEGGFRVFAFEAIANDQVKTAFTIKADLSLLQKYAIRLQELPLLCRRLLERDHSGEQKPVGTMIFTEDEMRLHARSCSEARTAALQKRKTPRKPMPSTSTAASGWRGSINGKTAPAPMLEHFATAK